MKKPTALVLFLLTCMILANCSKKDLPVSCFTMIHSQGITSSNSGGYVTFDPNCTENGYLFDWDLGNGVTSKERSFSYGYPEAGTYQITLKVTSSLKTDVSTQTLTVLGGCRTCLKINYMGDSSISEFCGSRYKANEDCYRCYTACSVHSKCKCY